MSLRRTLLIFLATWLLGITLLPRLERRDHIFHAMGMSLRVGGSAA